MKKIYKTLLGIASSILLCTNASAQTFPESFEGAVFPPTGWVSFDNGIGTVRNWTTSATAQSGSKSAFVRYEVVTGTAEDWLVSPATLISASTPSLSFWEKEQFTSDYGTTYNILVSVSSQTDVTTFTTVVSYPEDLTDPTNYRNNIIDLSSYAGQTIYIAFRMDNNDGDDWYLDNINLIGPCINPPSVGTITGPATATNGTVYNFTVAPSNGAIQWYYGATNIGPWTAISNATSAVQPINAIGSGTVYYTAVASNPGCPDDTTNTPLEVTVDFPNNTCDAILLPIGLSSNLYDLFNATTETGEVAPPGNGCSTNNSWCNNTLHNTRWFKFVAPVSGYVSVQSPDFDTQLAIWDAASCSDLLNAATSTLIAANDDDADYSLHSGLQYSSYVKAGCLTPGATYYIQLDSYSAASESDLTRVIVTDMGTPLNPSFTGLDANYCLSSPSTSLIPTNTGGVFSLNSSTTTANFDPASAGVGTHTVSYSIYGCTSSSITTVSSVCASIKENQNIVFASIYPNPNNGVVNVSIASEFAGSSKIEIYDAIGKLVLTQALNKEITTINTSSLESGIYMIKVINKNQDIKVSKMIKQ